MAIEKTTTQNGVRTFHTAGKYCDQDIVVTTNVEGSAPVLTTKNITENGTYAASSDGADGYSSVTVSVSGGGGGGDSGGKYLVQVFDYDGTILKIDHLNTGDTFTLPSQPNHLPRLVFNSWCTNYTITNNTVTVENEDINIGAVYDTASGKAEYDIEINRSTGKTITFKGGATSGDVVEWGDGTTTSDGTTTHTYENYGKYTITCTNTIISTTYPFGSTGNYNSILIGMFGISGITTSSISSQYSLKVVALKRPFSGTTANNIQVFNDCCSLDTIVVPMLNGGTGYFSCGICYNLKRFAIDGSSLGKISNSTSLESITMKNISSFRSGSNGNTNQLQRCVSLKRFSFPPLLSNVTQGMFMQCTSILEYDFTKCSSIPTLHYSSTPSNNPFYFINKRAKIVVPNNLYDQWIVATNWSALANYIYKASEV